MASCCSKPTVELDFFGMEKETTAYSTTKSLPEQKKKKFDRRRSFRDIQRVIRRINPELLKTVIESGCCSVANQGSTGKPTENGSSLPSSPIPSTPTFLRHGPAPVPVPVSENIHEVAPLTIFYKGSVNVFDVPRHKAEDILKLAKEEIVGAAEKSKQEVIISDDHQKQQQQLLETISRDLRMTRRKSLQRFLQKRKQRLDEESPYAYYHGYG